MDNKINKDKIDIDNVLESGLDILNRFVKESPRQRLENIIKSQEEKLEHLKRNNNSYDVECIRFEQRIKKRLSNT